ncbi:MAG: hypothetical protein Fur0032_10140 [Terrimicrobiaceae bacterium]
MVLKRSFLIPALLAVVALTGWRLLSGSDLITINMVDAPVGEVVAKLRKISGENIVTNADPATRVTLQLKNAQLLDAVSTLAERLDGTLLISAVLLPKKGDKEAGSRALTDRSVEGWASFQGGGWGWSAEPIDPRNLSLELVAEDFSSLHDLLRQASAKTGMAFAAPSDWNPEVTRLPKKNSAARVTSQLASAAGGTSSEVFAIRVRPPRQAADGGSGMAGGREDRGPRSGNMNPEWMAQRIEAEIQLLPVAEQPAAREEALAMREFWKKVRQAPEEERRALMEEFFRRPEVEERMEVRMAASDQRRSPEQRAQRYRRYVERKQTSSGAPR